MTASLTRCIAFLRGFNGAHDDWAEEIERLRDLLGYKADHTKDCAFVRAYRPMPCDCGLPERR